MVWVDWGILIVIALSVLFGTLRGFVKEALGLAAWVVGFWVALAHWDMLAAKLHGPIGSSGTAAVVAFAILLIGVLVIGALINHFIAKGLDKSGLKPLDRAMGALFGLFRGVAICAVLLLFAGLLHADGTESWKRSKLVPYFGPVVKWLGTHLDDQPDFGRGLFGKTG